MVPFYKAQNHAKLNTILLKPFLKGATINTISRILLIAGQPIGRKHPGNFKGMGLVQLKLSTASQMFLL